MPFLRACALWQPITGFQTGSGQTGFSQKGHISIYVVIAFFKCARVATCRHILSHVTVDTCCHMFSPFAHISPWKFIWGIAALLRRPRLSRPRLEAGEPVPFLQACALWPPRLPALPALCSTVGRRETRVLISEKGGGGQGRWGGTVMTRILIVRSQKPRHSERDRERERQGERERERERQRQRQRERQRQSLRLAVRPPRWPSRPCAPWWPWAPGLGGGRYICIYIYMYIYTHICI